MEFDFSKLEGRIIEKFGTRAAFGEAAELSPPALSGRLNNKTSWSCDDIYHVCQPHILDIPPYQIGMYFFTPKVR